jgi:hypothetical protein
METLSPRFNLPETWAARARCPVCSAGILQVVRQPGEPDRMACNNCQSVFQVEQNGGHVRFVKLPPTLEALLADRWVTMGEVKIAVKEVANAATILPSSDMDEDAIINARLAAYAGNPVTDAEPVIDHQSGASEGKKPPDSSPSPNIPLTEGEVLAKAQALYRLGNTYDQIEEILRRNPTVTSEQIQAARAALEEESAVKASQRQRSLFIAGGTVLLVILCCLAAGLLSRSMTGLFGIINVPSPGQPVDSQLKEATPEIVREDASSAQPGVCPANRLEAAKLFGGDSTGWTGSKISGWTMLNADSQTVHVPKGMKAVLVSGANSQTSSVSGPVQVKNVRAIKITCP